MEKEAQEGRKIGRCCKSKHLHHPSHWSHYGISIQGSRRHPSEKTPRHVCHAGAHTPIPRHACLAQAHLLSTLEGGVRHGIKHYAPPTALSQA
jgi:hypothetical protein